MARVSRDYTGQCPSLQQDTTYTAFLQPETVKEINSAGEHLLTYTYGDDYNRVKSELKQNGNTINTRYYYAGFETDQTGGTTRYIQYINSPAGLVAIIESNNGNHTPHYTYTDHLGSILTVLDAAGNIEADRTGVPAELRCLGQTKGPGELGAASAYSVYFTASVVVQGVYRS